MRSGLVVIVTLGVVVTGCSAGADDSTVTTDRASRGEAAEQETVQPSAEDTSALTLPLDAYTLSDVERAALHATDIDELTSCFESFGYTVRPETVATVGGHHASAGDRHARRYAVADPAVTAESGYHPPAGHDVREAFYTAHTDAELAVLIGVDTQTGEPVAQQGGVDVPEGGCLGQAQSSAPGDEAAAAEATPIDPADEAAVAAGEDLVSSIQADAWNSALSDPRVVDAFATWSACLAEAGYSYGAPMEANDDERWWRSAQATPEEIATATADVACKTEVSLIPRWSDVEAEYQSALIEEHREELDAYRALLDAEVDQARTRPGR